MLFTSTISVTLSRKINSPIGASLVLKIGVKIVVNSGASNSITNHKS
ncbi:MAG: hypothetical protein ACTJGP_13230 [Proteus vulgaris]|nr:MULTISPECIES: hypothetical protein [Morganellaceae]HEK0657672.1 hypothetical protein [Proteus mirabilis]